MDREPHTHDHSLEADEVWKLLDQAPAPLASARFKENTLRAARLEDSPAGGGWWQKLMSPAPLGGLLAATAAAAFAVVSLTRPVAEPETPTAAHRDPAPVAERSEDFAALQEAVELEALIAAVDQLDDFSDHELVSLIGF